MDFWVEDVMWRNSRWQQGKDDWEFYWEKYGEYFSPGVPVDWNSGPLKALSAYKHPNSYFTIRTSLGKDEWQYLMEILARINVSQIKHIEVELMKDFSPGIRHLSNVLGSGAFSGLKTLKIRIPTGEALGWKESTALQEALETGRFVNLVTLSLPACTCRYILQGLMKGKIYKMRSFSIMGERVGSGLDGTLTAAFARGFFKHLQHLEIARVTDDEGNLDEYFSATKSGLVPNLTSLSLRSNEKLRLTDLAPFLLSNALENLIMDGCQIGPWQFERLMDTLLKDACSSLALKRVDLHNNQLSDSAVHVLVRLAQSNKLAQLQELDLSMNNSGMNSRTLETLMETIQEGRLPSLKLLIWDRDENKDSNATEAFVRLQAGNDGLPDEWYQVLYRPPEVKKDTGVSDRSNVPDKRVFQYNVKRILLNDMRNHKVVWNRDIPHYLLDSGSGVSKTRMKNFRALLETSVPSPVAALRLKITSEKSGEGLEGSAHFAAALMAGYFTSKLTPFLPAGDVNMLTLSLPASHVGAILGAFNVIDISPLRALSIITVEGLDDYSRSSLYQKLDTALTGGCFESLQHLELSNGMLDGVDVWEILTGAIECGKLERITSVCLVRNLVADVRSLHPFDFCQHKVIIDGCRINSEQVLGLADTLLNFRQTGFSLEELELSNGVLDGVDGWKVLTQAINSGNLPNITSLCLSQNALHLVHLEDLVPLIWSNSFVNLVMDGCWISTQQLCGLADALMSGPATGLALKQLNLGDNRLGQKAVDALVNLAYSDILPQLQILNLGMNKGLGVVAFKILMETIQRRRLCSLETLIWVGNPVGDADPEAIVEAYYANEDLTMTFDIDWDQVKDPALKTKVDEYRARNIRLCALKEQHKDVLEDLVPLSCAKVFLCGYPRVGKTTLARALAQSTPETQPLKEAPTRGIELSQLEETNMTLTIWDLAGQEEYHVLHGTFFVDLGLASGKATIFVLVLRASFTKAAADVEKDLLYWFRFMASSSQKHVKRRVVIVLNCFGGQQCTTAHVTLWMALIGKFEESFRDFLHIRLVPFSLDVRFPESVQPLKDWLFDQAQVLLQNVMVPRVCFQLQEEVKRWSQGDKNSHLPIMTWASFQKHVNLKRMQNQLSEQHLKAAALYLHEMGGMIYLDQMKWTETGSRNRVVVVLYPEWFCKQVVGELLLPEDLLEEGCSLIQHESGLIPIHWFECHFKNLLVKGTQSDDIITMLERVGLCYRKGNNNIMVPALIKEDDTCLTHWEDEGCQLVIGRSLCTEDYERTAIPITLFRRLQVELALDTNFGGRGGSEYRARKYSSSFKVGELSFLIQVEANSSIPTDNRIDVLAKTADPTKGSLLQVEQVCEIMQKLQVLSFACCPGLRYDIRVIKPWSATKETPKMTERKLLPLREIKHQVMQGQRYSSWQVDRNAVELKAFLSSAEMETIRNIQIGIKIGTNEVTQNADFPEVGVGGMDYYYDSDFSEGSEDPHVSSDGVEESELPDVSSQVVEEIEELGVQSELVAETKDVSGDLLAEDSVVIVNEEERERFQCTPSVQG
ncbi:unnamed protein product [Calypogeia fissa]